MIVKMKKFSIIVAATSNNLGIGCHGKLPWKLKGDMHFFRKITTKTESLTKLNAVIMGRKTYESIPETFRPLSNRLNVVLSRNSQIKKELNLPESVIVSTSLEEALTFLSTPEMSDVVDEVFIIGGGSIYKEAINSPLCNKIYLTSVEDEFDDIDTFFPVIDKDKYILVKRSEPKVENSINYHFLEFQSTDIQKE
jgi:dihydrofolate reductase